MLLIILLNSPSLDMQSTIHLIPCRHIPTHNVAIRCQIWSRLPGRTEKGASVTCPGRVSALFAQVLGLRVHHPRRGLSYLRTHGDLGGVFSPFPTVGPRGPPAVGAKCGTSKNMAVKVANAGEGQMSAKSIGKTAFLGGRVAMRR